MNIITKLAAAEELERIAMVCKTTKLSIAAVMGANALRAEAMTQDTKAGRAVKHDCPTCKHRDRMPGLYPCDGCSSDHDKWEGRGI